MIRGKVRPGRSDTNRLCITWLVAAVSVSLFMLGITGFWIGSEPCRRLECIRPRPKGIGLERPWPYCLNGFSRAATAGQFGGRYDRCRMIHGKRNGGGFGRLILCISFTNLTCRCANDVKRSYERGAGAYHILIHKAAEMHLGLCIHMTIMHFNCI